MASPFVIIGFNEEIYILLLIILGWAVMDVLLPNFTHGLSVVMAAIVGIGLVVWLIYPAPPPHGAKPAAQQQNAIPLFCGSLNECLVKFNTCDKAGAGDPWVACMKEALSK